MKFKNLLELAKSLASSQGFYTRLYENLKDATKEQQEAITEEMKAHDLKDNIDMILWLEG